MIAKDFIRITCALMASSLLITNVASQPVATSNLNLTTEEWDWIVKNPKVRVAIDSNWRPIAYLSNGRAHGLTSSYLKTISHKSGLGFELVSVSGGDDIANKLTNSQIDILPATLRSLVIGEIAQSVDFTRPYYVGGSVVISRDNGKAIFSLEDLNGKSVAVKNGSGYQVVLEKKYPDIQLIKTNTVEETLTAVLQNKADVALGFDAAMLPFLRRKYASVLYVSGVISTLPGDLAMGVHKDLPLLHSIINKSLASITAKESDNLDAEWLSGIDYGMPSVDVMLHFYGTQLSMILGAILIITIFAYRAHVDRRRATQSERTKSMFLAVMSHEIRSPMHAVLASIELLQGTGLNKQQKKLSDLASSGARTLLRLLDEVLDISKLQAGQLELDLASEDIVEVVRRTLDLQQINAQAKGISLVLEKKADFSSHLLIDASRVTQIMHNLVSNAIKFTNRGGVTVSMDLGCPDDSNKESSSNVSKTIQVIVRDTGVGIELEQQAKLFRPYAQADKSTSRLFGGTGLGLVICRELVTLMNGTISIESKVGIGTTVIVQWPVSLTTTSNTLRDHPLVRVTSMPPNINTQQPNILLVEDTAVNAAVIVAQLNELGCRADRAENGEEAIDLLTDNRYDLILMDCDLPQINGYDTTRKWRTIEANKKLKPIPILALSASVEFGHTERCFESGMDGTLKKPIMLNTLRDAIDVWCERGSSSVAPAVNLTAIELVGPCSSGVYDADMRALVLALQQNDRTKAIHYSHRLVGAALTLNNENLARSAHVLERYLRDGSELESAEVRDAHHNLIQDSR